MIGGSNGEREAGKCTHTKAEKKNRYDSSESYINTLEFGSTVQGSMVPLFENFIQPLKGTAMGNEKFSLLIEPFF